MDFSFDLYNLYLIGAILCILIIAMIFYIIYRNKVKSHLEIELNLQAEVKILKDKTEDYKNEKMEISSKLHILQNKIEKILYENGILENECKNLKNKLETQKNELTDLQEKFTTEFKNIAHDILKENTSSFTSLSQKNIKDILHPLQEKIKDFETKVEKSYDSELRDKISLREEIRKLYQMNEKLSSEASNLTIALKGDVKKQGYWGELVLEKILERSGLRKGNEYIVQKQMSDTHGKIYKPDIIVYLPDNKQLIIDSKVSILDYEKYVSADNTNPQKSYYLKRHITSLKNHIDSLSKKNYQNLLQVKTLDFILMFIPIESAFSVAVEVEQSLFYHAFEKNIIIVSPSTLLATLRTINNIWKMEYQNKNAMEIAKQSGLLYDKFVGFVTDMLQLKKRLNDAQSSYEDAMNKLTYGKGNLITKTENIKKLGARTAKSLPKNFLDKPT